jgi:flagellar hook-length control protein FliK
VPRVASEASSVQSHHLNPGLRRPAAPDANNAPSGTSSPFAALLDDTTAASDDLPDRPQPSAPPTSAPSTSSAQGDRRVRRGSDTTADAGQPGAPADTSNDDAPATTDGKIDGAKAADTATAGDITVAVDTTGQETSAPTEGDDTNSQSPTADVQAAVPAVAAPAAVVPTITIAAPNQAGTTDDGAAAAAQAVTALSAPAQDAAEALTGAKGKSGPQGPDASRPDSSKAPATTKVLNAKQSTGTDATPTTVDATPADGDAPSGTQGAAQPGSATDPNAPGKSAHTPAHTGRSTGTDAVPKSDDADTRVATATATTTDKPADTLQVTPLAHQPSDRASAPAAAATTATPTTDATPTTVPVAGLAVEIASQAQAGRNRFEIRLDPPELGRIDVRIDVHKDGQVTSRLVVEKAETLDLLRRDAPTLERALQDAGLKTSDNGLQFSLRDQGLGNQNQAWSDGNPGNAARVVVPDPDMPPVEIAQNSYTSSLRTGGGVDIRV